MSTTNAPAPTDYKSAKAEAKAAKAYAKATRPFFRKKRYWALGSLAAIVAIIVMSQSGGGSDTPAADGGSSVSQSAKPDLTVRASKLINDFEKNELAADKTYDGKTLKVTGVVDKIDTDVWDDSKYILNLTGGGEFEILSVSVHGMSNGELSKITTGEKVTVIAKFDDGGDLGVDLKDAHLV